MDETTPLPRVGTTCRSFRLGSLLRLDVDSWRVGTPATSNERKEMIDFADKRLAALKRPRQD